MGRPRKHRKDLPSCVYQRHGAFWLVRKGKWIRLGTDMHGALAAYAGMVTGPKDKMPALIEEAFPIITKNLEPGSRSQYRAAANRLKDILRDFEPREVLPGDVARIKRALSDMPNTANRCIGVLRQVFNYALEEEIVTSNPCLGIKRLRENERDRYLADAEFLAIQAQASPVLQTIMDLCYLTAQRISDVLALRRADITDDGIFCAPSKVRKKTKQKLLVRWTAELKTVVDRAGSLHEVRGFTLLHDRRGQPLKYRTVKDWWDRARDAAQVKDANIHDIRAKSLTDAENQGLNPQLLAGHSERKMTERYIRLRQVPAVSGPSFGHVQKKAS